MFNCKRRKWEMNGLFFVVLIILNKDINVCSVEIKGRNSKGMSFSILAKFCYVVDERKLFECLNLYLV
jgi:hypothetical protein